jgi:hypothetical protein
MFLTHTGHPLPERLGVGVKCLRLGILTIRFDTFGHASFCTTIVARIFLKLFPSL